MDLSIIIVSWNTRQLLDDCLASVSRETKSISFEIFVVDNASSDGSAEMVKGRYPQVRLIENKKNAGFSAANNQAAKVASGRYILFLNSDTVILDGALDKGVCLMDSRPEIAILGAKTFNCDMTHQKTVAPDPDLWAQIFLLLKVKYLFPKAKFIKNLQRADFDYEKEGMIRGHTQGSFMLARREALEKVGLFDENFYIWFEEVDLCHRFTETGYKILYSPEIKIIHRGGESFKRVMTLKKQWMYNRSLFYYFRKNKPRWQYYVLRLFEIPSLLLAMIAGTVKRLQRSL